MLLEKSFIRMGSPGPSSFPHRVHLQWAQEARWHPEGSKGWALLRKGMQPRINPLWYRSVGVPDRGKSSV